MNTSALLKKAKEGAITATEIENVADELRNGSSRADPYTLLNILGHASALRHEVLIAKYLDSPDDPMLARIALMTLCTWFGRFQSYKEIVNKFASGIEWDRDGEVRRAAISILGESARSTPGAESVRLLIDLFDRSDDWSIQQAAYFALARASGQEWAELPSAARQMRIPEDCDPEVMHWISERR